jgi:hypothetical protein
MKIRKLAAVLPLVLALSVPAVDAVGAAASQAATATQHAAMMTVTKTGTFEKWISKTSFGMNVGMKSYTVKVNDMTHVSENGMNEKLSSLKKGDAIKVKGELEMGTLLATSIVITKM